MIDDSPVAGTASIARLRPLRLAALCLILATTAFLTSCSTPSRRGGASLGDAAETSAKKAEEKKEDPREEAQEPRTRTSEQDDEPLQIGEKVDDDSSAVAEVGVAAAALAGDSSSSGSAEPGDAELAPGAEHRSERWHITPSFSFLGVAGDAYEMQWGAGLEVGSYVSSRMRVEGGIQYIDMEFLESQQRLSGLTDPSEIQIDLRARFYLTEAHTFASAYAILGFKAGAFGWMFVEPVDVVENGEMRTVSSDFIFTATPYLGCGIAPVQWGRFHLGASFTLGLRILQEATQEGFENDLFPDVGTWELRLGASYFL